MGIEIPKSTVQHRRTSTFSLGYFSKLGDVKILLYISLWIGIVHLFLGLDLGFYNMALRHGLKHAFMEKGSWLMILVGFALVGCWS